MSIENGMTIAMHLVKKRLKIQPQWNHDPDTQDNDGMTVAMHFVEDIKDIPAQWEHDPEI